MHQRWISQPYFSKLTIDILLISGTTPESHISERIQLHQVQNAMLYFQHRRIWTYAVKFLSHLGAFYAKKNLKTRKKTLKSKVTKQAPNLDDLLGNKAGQGVTKPTMCCESRSISKAETGWFLFKRSDEFRAEYCNCSTPIIIY